MSIAVATGHGEVRERHGGVPVIGPVIGRPLLAASALGLDLPSRAAAGFAATLATAWFVVTLAATWFAATLAAAWFVAALAAAALGLVSGLGALSAPLAAQEARPPAADTMPRRIEGSVRARPADGGDALAYAMIQVDGQASVLADRSGRYVLRDVRPGLVRVVASHVGYAPAEVEVLVPGSGIVTVDLELVRQVVELPGIVVSGERLRIDDPDERTVAAGATRAMVGLRALEASPGLAEAGIGQAVGDGRPGPGEPGEALLMRGSSADLKLVLLDGAPIYAPFHLGGLLPGFDAATLGAARHHVGGAPARYDGGLSYILDLRTRSPRRDRIRTRASVDLMSVGGSLETPLGEHAGLLVAGRKLHGLGASLAGGEGSPYGFGDGLVRLEADTGEDGAVFLTGFANEEAVFLDLGASPHPPVEPLGESQHAVWGNRALAGGWAGSVGDGTRLEIGASTSRYDAELPVHETVTDSVSGASTWTVLATGRTTRDRFTVDAVRPSGSAPLRFGLSLDRMTLTYGARGRPLPEGGSGLDGQGSVVGGYVEGTSALGEGLDLRWGGRLDRFSVDASRVDDGDASFRGALRLALLWDLGDDALLTLAAGRYHQLARRGDADIELAVGVDPVQTGTGVVLEDVYLAGPILTVAQADHVVASLDQRIGESVDLETGLFLKSFRNVAGVSSRRLTSSGIDLRVLRQGDRTSAWLGYSLAWFWEPTGSGSVSEFSGRHLLNMGLTTPLAGPLGLDLRLSFSDGLPLTSIPFGRLGGADRATNEPGGFTETLAGSPRVDLEPESVDGFLRIDAEVFAEWETGLGGLEGRIRPYLKVLNALDRRDALFYYFEPWRSDGLRPLAELSLVPVAGLEWRF